MDPGRTVAGPWKLAGIPVRLARRGYCVCGQRRLCARPSNISEQNAWIRFNPNDPARWGVRRAVASTGLDGPKRTLFETVRRGRFAVMHAGEAPGNGARSRTCRQDVSEEHRVGSISKRLSLGPASQFQPGGYEGTCSMRGNLRVMRNSGLACRLLDTGGARDGVSGLPGTNAKTCCNATRAWVACSALGEGELRADLAGVVDFVADRCLWIGGSRKPHHAIRRISQTHPYR